MSWSVGGFGLYTERIPEDSVTMGLYSRYLMPRIVNLACSAKPTRKQREKVVPRARGVVLEVGIGSGLNLPFYDTQAVTRVWGLEPDEAMRRLARKRAEAAAFQLDFIDLPGDEIPLDAQSVDTVLITYTLCTIPETEPALRQMARVLKPGGRLIFCEHGLAPDERVRRWQDRCNPIWKRLGGGCNLNRDIPSLLEAGGFQPEELNRGYIPGWRPASYNYWGTAVVP